MKFFKKIKNNNDGTIMFNRVTCYFLLFIVIMFGVDICLLFTQTVVTSYQTAYYAEKISVQGGLLGDTPVLPGAVNSGTGSDGNGTPKTCSSCYTNAAIGESFGKTMENFGLTPYDWNIAVIDEGGTKVWVHSNGATTSPSQKLRLPYMSVNELFVNSKFVPKLSKWLWKGATIQKQITFISEYIER